jgi:long-chain acyl-CoA synthetase
VPLNPELYRRTLQLPSGVRLSAIDVHPEHPERTLVLLHGFGGSAAQWEHILRAFGDRHRVVALDLRGHGRSDKPASAYTMDEVLHDLEQAFDALTLQGPVVLWGHSFGGAIAAEFVVRHPQRVERLVTSSATSDYHLGAHISLLFHLPSQVLEGVRAAVRILGGKLWMAPAHVLKPLYLRNLSKWKGSTLYPQVGVPTLVLTGARDYLFRREALHRVATLIPGAEHVEIPAAYHNIMLDRSAAVARAVERFIGQERTWRSRGPSPGARGEGKPWLARYQAGVPPSVAVPRQPLHRLLEQSAQRHPRRVALRFAGGTTSYRKLWTQAQRFAGALRDLGVQPGDRVLLALPNSPPLVVGYYGALLAGCAVVLGNPLTAPPELARQAKDSGARAAIVATAMPQHTMALEQAGVPNVVRTRLADWGGPLARALARDPRVRGAADLQALMAAAKPWRAPAEPAPEALAVLAYTSGTTDEPKGVMLSHRALVANTLQLRHWLPEAREGKEVLLAALPLTHSYGMTACMNLGISLAATLVLLPRFDLDEALHAIARAKPTLLPGVPPMYNAIAHHPKANKKRLRSIRVCVSGAAPLPVEVQEGFERVTRARLVEGYGLTEAGPVTHANPLNDQRKVGSIGLPLPGTEAMVVDLDTGMPVAPGEVGELLVKGPQLMSGYWQRPEESAEVLTKDGWLRTGDLASMDEDGAFRIVDRKKDMVVHGRMRIYPRDVEEILYEHPKVFEAAVVGQHGAEAGAKPWLRAFVVLKRDESASSEEILAHCRKRLQDGLVPDGVEFRQDLPKSFVGKVLRRLLVEGPGR